MYPEQRNENHLYWRRHANFIISETVRCATKGVRGQLTFDDRNEFTVEANPGDLTQEKLQVMKNYGVNRLSMGVQTFDDRLLKKSVASTPPQMFMKQ